MNNINNTMRVYHRYLGFFLAGIMAVYAVSGIVMIFRETEFLKSEVITEKILPKDFKTEKMHKATTNEPLFFLNIFFGLSLLFFVVSSFWMFMPKTAIFKKGVYFTIGGIVLTLILLYI